MINSSKKKIKQGKKYGMLRVKLLDEFLDRVARGGLTEKLIFQ